MANKIKFSHNYCKLYNQIEAKLMSVWLTDFKSLHTDLIEYDTKYIPELTDSCESHTDFEGDIEHCHYPLPKNDLVILSFIGDKHIPFCTIRSAKGRYCDKYQYYSNKIGQWFDIIIENNV